MRYALRGQLGGGALLAPAAEPLEVGRVELRAGARIADGVKDALVVRDAVGRGLVGRGGLVGEHL